MVQSATQWNNKYWNDKPDRVFLFWSPWLLICIDLPFFTPEIFAGRSKASIMFFCHWGVHAGDQFLAESERSAEQWDVGTDSGATEIWRKWQVVVESQQVLRSSKGLCCWIVSVYEFVHIESWRIWKVHWLLRKEMQKAWSVGCTRRSLCGWACGHPNR